MTDQAPTPKRINVAVTPDEVAAIELVIDREGVTLTEAVRRLIGFGEFVYRTARVDGDQVLCRDSEGNLREVVLL